MCHVNASDPKNWQGLYHKLLVWKHFFIMCRVDDNDLSFAMHWFNFDFIYIIINLYLAEFLLYSKYIEIL